jgi:hypothetical protein
MALLLPALIRRHWRLLLLVGLAVAAVPLASVLLLGREAEGAFWREVVPTLGARTTRLSNQSLYGMIGRTLYPGSARSGDGATILPLASFVHAVAAALVLGATAWALHRSRRGSESLEAISAVICAVLLVIPVSWDHYQALLLLPLLAGCAFMLRGAGRGELFLGAYALLAFGTYKNVQNGLIQSEVVLFLASYRVVGLLLLWAWWLAWLHEGASVERHPPTCSGSGEGEPDGGPCADHAFGADLATHQHD